jgi:hypothetical protein
MGNASVAEPYDFIPATISVEKVMRHWPIRLNYVSKQVFVKKKKKN